MNNKFTVKAATTINAPAPLSGVPDPPENFHTVTYELTDEDGKTEVTISQDNNASQKDADHSTKNWKTVLDGMKKLLES